MSDLIELENILKLVGTREEIMEMVTMQQCTLEGLKRDSRILRKQIRELVDLNETLTEQNKKLTEQNKKYSEQIAKLTQQVKDYGSLWS